MSSIVSQSVVAKLTRAAIFIVLKIDVGHDAETTVRGLCADLSSLVRGVGFRRLGGQLSCITGFGTEAWDRLFAAPRPKELHAFREIRGVHTAVSTPGDILFHIRASSMDQCFELASNIMARLSGHVSVADEVHGFKFFDDRDLLGFVDGTENPVDQAAAAATLIGSEDPEFAGGSYVIVQKYLHDLDRWNKVPVEEQENIVGRHKLSDIEQRDSDKKPYAHNVLTNIEENGEQLQILRDNMPFGEIGKGEFGTYFIGFARSPSRIEKMLQNMFVGNPPGTYDHLLDFSRAVTGCLFFVPTSIFLDAVSVDAAPIDLSSDADDVAPATDLSDRQDAPPKEASVADGSLRIGSLKKKASDE